MWPRGLKVRTLGRQNERNFANDWLALTSIFGLCFMSVCLIKSNCYSLIYTSLIDVKFFSVISLKTGNTSTYASFWMHILKWRFLSIRYTYSFIHPCLRFVLATVMHWNSTKPEFLTKAVSVMNYPFNPGKIPELLLQILSLTKTVIGWRETTNPATLRKLKLGPWQDHF